MLRTVFWAMALAVFGADGHAEETWRGLRVAQESRCSPYERERDYSYPRSIEPRIVDAMRGRVFGPYTGRYFESMRETDIEHIVAMSEAHDSGLCAATADRRREFARDLLNLTLAAREVNGRKGAKDAAEWLPDRNRCWFAGRVVEVRRRYDLTIDRHEADVLDTVLHDCDSTELVFAPRATEDSGTAVDGIAAFATSPDAAGTGDADPLRRYDDNGNGRINCAEARRHGIAPVPRSHPAYAYMRDGDGDGWVCE